MAETVLSPEIQTVSIGTTSFTLNGAFATLKALQLAFAKDIVQLQGGVLEMRQDELSKLIAVAAVASGEQTTVDDIGALMLDQIDITGTEYFLLKAAIMTWLAVSIAPKADREKKALEMVSRLKMLQTSASLGTTTNASA